MQSAREAAGAVGIRRSPRPLWAEDSSMPRAHSVARTKLFQINKNAPHSPPSSPANGSAEWPPDDRLRRAIQYSEASMMESKSCGVLDTPHARGMTVFVRSALASQFRRRHSEMRRQAQTSDVQLHIGESRDSGFDASHRPGMTGAGLLRGACHHTH